VRFTDIERRGWDAGYTAQTIKAVAAALSRTRVCCPWGPIILAQFHRWEELQQIIEAVPLGGGLAGKARGRIPARPRRQPSFTDPTGAQARMAFRSAYAQARMRSFVNVLPDARGKAAVAIRAKGW